MFSGGFFKFGGRVEGGGGLRGRIFPWRNFSGGKILSMEGVQDFLALFKKQRKNKYEIFFYWKWGAALKLKTNRNYYAYEGFTSS